MPSKRTQSEKTKVRRDIVLLALNKLLSNSNELDRQAILEQQVFVAGHLSPESFTEIHKKGESVVLLRFVRATEYSAWELDENQFLIIEDP